MIVFKYILMAILVFALLMLLAIPTFLIYKLLKDE